MALVYKSKIDVLVVDDNQIYHDGLEPLLKKFEFVENVKHVYNGKEALKALANNSYRLVLMDYKMPVMNGAECTAKIKKHYPHVKIIALSLYDDQKSVIKMVNSGVDAYLLKNTSMEEIETAIEKIFTGRHYFTPEISELVIEKAVANIHKGFIPFTDRETEILLCMWEDLSNKEISAKLDISERTIEGHRQNMFYKADVKTIVGLIRYSLSNGLISEITTG